MTPTRTTPSVDPPKKRRTFFASNLPFIPKLPAPSTSRPAITPRSQVLAALSGPEERALNAPRPVREKKQRVLEGTATPEQLAEASTSRPKSTRQRSPPAPKPDTEPAPTPSSSRPKRVKPTIAKVETPIKSPHRRTPTSTSQRQNTSSHRSAPLYETPKGQKGSKAVNAQNSNAALSALMEKSMRATIGGRERPYMRVPVWEEPSRSRKKKTTTTTTTIVYSKPGKQNPARTARLRAKQRQAEKEAEDDEEGLYEDVDEEALPMARKDKGKGKAKAGSGKEYMNAGFYCQDANAKSPYKLVNRILNQASSSGGLQPGKRKLRDPLEAFMPKLKKGTAKDRLTFPPLPYDHGYDHFFGKEHEFQLPYNIHQEAESGAFNDKKKPAPYQKIRGNVFPERPRVTADRAICKCAPDSGCGDNCINRIMSYLCGKDCPCGEACTNRSLVKRPMAQTKVGYTGSRGFGLFAMEDIKEGEFVTDYRGEVISLNTFYQRIRNEYAGQKNFYALAYDQDEVIDSGMRGNDARFINHGCSPNLEVRKYQTLGDGMEEYEIGMWAVKDIQKGEELFYDYNFDCFGGAKDDLRTQCRCGATNCVGFLGRKPGEKSAKDIAIELDAKKAADAVRLAAKSRGKKVVKKFGTKVGSKKTIKFSSAVERAKKAAVQPKQSLALSKSEQLVSSHSEEVKAVDPGLSGSSGPQEDALVDIAVTTAVDLDAPPTAGPSTSTTTTTLISTAPPLTPSRSIDSNDDGASDGSQSASAKRKSGWANWLRKIAAEKTRTLEEWHEERMKRRRGIAWMNMMIAEFGVAPSPAPATPEAYSDGRKPAGSSASFANTLASQGLGPGPAGIRNLGGPKNVYRSDNWNKAREETTGGTPGPSRSEDFTPTKRTDSEGGHSVSSKKRRTSPTLNPAASPLTDVNASAQLESGVFGQSTEKIHSALAPLSSSSFGIGENQTPARKSQKAKAIAARNGAPMGWAFVDPNAVPARGSQEPDLELPRSARRARQSVARDEVLRPELIRAEGEELA